MISKESYGKDEDDLNLFHIEEDDDVDVYHLFKRNTEKNFEIIQIN